MRREEGHEHQKIAHHRRGTGPAHRSPNGRGVRSWRPGLPPLGDKWLTENPYRGNPLAIKIGAHGYTQNCARCHGIDAVSGGIAPDLRNLDPGPDGDEWFIQLTRNGYKQNGVEKMPKFEGILGQEAMWAIRAWLDTRTASLQSR